MISDITKIKLRDTDIKILDGDRGTNYPKKIDFSSSGYCLFLDASNVTENGFVFESSQFITSDRDKIMRNGKLHRNDIVLTTRGTIGNFAYYNSDVSYENVRINSGMLIIRNGRVFDTRYLYQLFKSPIIKQQIDNITTGSSQPQLTQSIVQELILLKPELSVQRLVANLLSSIDSKIELNKKINAELEALAKMLYDYWFVQFDFPDENGEPYKSSGGKMIWCEGLQKEIPELWSVNRIGSILETSLGGTPSTARKDYWENGTINWLNSGEVANFPVVNSEQRITQQAIDGSATELLPARTTLLSITRHLRPTILAIDACVNQSVVGIHEKGEITCYYVYPYLKNEIPRLLITRTGAQQPHINKESVDDSLIIMPDEKLHILKKYNEQVKPIYDMIINNAFQNQKLSELRNWLLPMLMNGQVTVN